MLPLPHLYNSGTGTAMQKLMMTKPAQRSVRSMATKLPLAAQQMSEASLVSVSASTPDIQQHANSLLERLQTTLELTSLLTIFADYVSPKRWCDAICFSTDTQVFELYDNQSNEAHGQPHQHTALLYADEVYLGQLVYTLKHPLSMAIRRQLDILHKQLAFPLRNALLFAQTRQQALHDYLTELGNRNYLEEVLQHAIYQQQRLATPVSVMLIDLDGFKAVNDEHGHARGDEVLRAFAQLLKRQLRECDQIFRFGGDEFVLVLEDTQALGAQQAFQRLQRALHADANLATLSLSMSAGLTLLTAEDSVQAMLQRVDDAMYAAKGAGKNQLVCRSAAAAL